MIRFEGDRQVPLAPADAWLKLRDARFLLECIQGGQPFGDAPTQDQAQCTVRPNVPFLRGAMQVTVRIAAAKEPTALRILVLGQSSTASSEVENQLTLAENQGGTQVHWLSEVRKLGGTLKLTPARQVEEAMQKVINEVWNLATLKLGK